MPGAAAAVAVLLLVAAVAAVDADPRRRPLHGNPAAEITAVARVEDAPRRTTHRNGRSFEELSVVLLSAEPPAPNSGGFAFALGPPVKIVHDLTCGGTWVDAKPGDRLDLRGEYVHTPSGHDLIHFTHPAGGRCGASGAHPDGYLRLAREAASDHAAPRFSPATLEAFRASVRPILSARCGPCHEAGGKMYGRLPFDDPATVASHAEKMTRRLKDDDRRTLQAWAAGASAALEARSE
jgi:hypothetical protein